MANEEICLNLGMGYVMYNVKNVLKVLKNYTDYYSIFKNISLFTHIWLEPRVDYTLLKYLWKPSFIFENLAKLWIFYLLGVCEGFFHPI